MTLGIVVICLPFGLLVWCIVYCSGLFRALVCEVGSMVLRFVMFMVFPDWFERCVYDVDALVLVNNVGYFG